MSHLGLAPVVAALAAVGTAALGQEAPPPGREKPGNRLVGVWQSEAGSRLVYLDDGTGKNPDGSRFTWRLEREGLFAQALSPDGKPVGGAVTIPISFTRDGKEYTTTLQPGRFEFTYYRLGPDRQPDRLRTAEGRVYVSGPKAAKRVAVRAEDEFAPLPVFDEPPLPASKTGSIVVGPNVQVSRARGDVPHWEVIVEADPADSRRLLAGSICNPPPIDYGVPKVVSYASSDGGTTWEPSLDRIGGKREVFADPTAAYGPSGTLYFANLSGPSLGDSRGAVEVSVSRDGGKSWDRPTRTAGWRDRPFLTVDRTGGPYRGRLYCVTADGVFASADQGKTFGPPVSWTRRRGHLPIGSGNAVVLSDGRLVALSDGHLSDADLASAITGTPPAYLAIRVSRDGGATFGAERVVAEGRIAPVPPCLASGPVGSPFQDHLFVVWNGNQPGIGPRIMVARSVDGGETWEKPTALSEQADRGAGAGKVSHSAYLPAIAVNKNGIVGVSWHDSRGLPVKQAGYHIRFRASADGGKTWRPSVRVTTAPTLWTAPVKRRYSQPGEEEGYWKGGPGHTAGLAADAQGVFHPLWIDGRTGVRQVFTATVTLTP